MTKKQKLTPIQGVLINQSGLLGHRLRSNKSILEAPKMRKSRRDKQAER
jgi:hypothetical protein